MKKIYSYSTINISNYEKEKILVSNLTKEELSEIKTVSKILPFKSNNYVVNELINWDDFRNDPLFKLTFPNRKMLLEEHFDKIDYAIKNSSEQELKSIVKEIRLELNPNPAGQKDKNVPYFNGKRLEGIQHKYDETVLFFPKHSQLCHAFCTFCFRWSQFVGDKDLRFANQEAEDLVKYIKANPQITDILFTGGDPMVMSAEKFLAYIDPILNANIPHLKSIRIGSKSLSFWPYRFLTDKDADDLLRIFEKIVNSGYHLAFMAHFNHPNELKTDAVKRAIKRIQGTGAVIRTQSPLLKNVNANSSIWKEMWEKQVNLGLIPYYMFVARNTGAQKYFSVKLNKAYEIFTDAYQQVSGLTRTVRGPSMSATEGKIQIIGIDNILGQKVFILKFLQARNSDAVGKPFFAKYNPDAIWIDDLEPAFDSDYFFRENSMVINQ